MLTKTMVGIHCLRGKNRQTQLYQALLEKVAFTYEQEVNHKSQVYE